MAEDGAKPLKATWFKLDPPTDPRRLPAHEHVESKVRTLDQEFAWHPNLATIRKEFVGVCLRDLESHLPPKAGEAGLEYQNRLRRYNLHVNNLYEKVVRRIKHRSSGLFRKNLGIVSPGSKSDRKSTPQREEVVSDLAGAVLSPPADPDEEQRFILARLRAHLERHSGEVSRFLELVEELLEVAPPEVRDRFIKARIAKLLTTKQAAEELGLTPGAVKTAAQKGELGIQLGRDYLYTAEEVAAYKAREKPKGGRPRSKKSEEPT